MSIIGLIVKILRKFMKLWERVPSPIKIELFNLLQKLIDWLNGD